MNSPPKKHFGSGFAKHQAQIALQNAGLRGESLYCPQFLPIMLEEGSFFRKPTFIRGLRSGDFLISRGQIIAIWDCFACVGRYELKSCCCLLA